MGEKVTSITQALYVLGTSYDCVEDYIHISGQNCMLNS